MATDANLVITGPAAQFVFQKYEIPEWVHFGGPYRHVVHSFPGGTRQIDMLGPDDGPISWSGIMLTADASVRANTLFTMYEAGDRCTVEFGDWAFACIISNLKISYKASNYCEYSIELTRVINAADLGENIAPAPDDLGNAQNLIPGAAIPPAQ